MFSIKHLPDGTYEVLGVSSEGESPSMRNYTKDELSDFLDTESHEFIFYPPDLVFDVDNSPDGRYIYIGLKFDESCDHLGHHNVKGLPGRYTVEDCECTWTVDDDALTDQQVIDELVTAGFTHEKFL